MFEKHKEVIDSWRVFLIPEDHQHLMDNMELALAFLRNDADVTSDDMWTPIEDSLIWRIHVDVITQMWGQEAAWRFANGDDVEGCTIPIMWTTLVKELVIEMTKENSNATIQRRNE